MYLRIYTSIMLAENKASNDQMDVFDGISICFRIAVNQIL